VLYLKYHNNFRPYTKQIRHINFQVPLLTRRTF